MPTLAETLVSSGLKQAAESVTANPGSGLAVGADLAKHVMAVKQQRAELEQKKIEIQNQKLQHFNDQVSKVHEFKDSASRNGYVKFLKSQNQQLGLGVPDEALDFAFASKENVARVATLQTMVQDGTLKGPQAIAILTQPDQFAKIVPKDKYASYTGPKFDANSLGDVDIQEASDKIAQAYKEKQANDAQAMKAGSYQINATTKLDDQGATAVNRINTDDQLKTFTMQHQNIQKGKELLMGTPSWKMVNEVLQDYSTALNPKGGGSDFKLKEFTSPSAAQKLSEAFAFATANPDQPASKATVKWLKDMGDRLQMTYGAQIKDRAVQLKKELPTVYAHNPGAVKAGEGAAESYINGTWTGAKTESAAPTVMVGGREIDLDTARAFYKAHPEMKPSVETKKALGI
jgi:hypothetical protein